MGRLQKRTMPWDELAGASVLIFFMHYYYFAIISLQFYRGSLIFFYARQVDGTEAAPYQYRMLVPWLVAGADSLHLLPSRHLVLLMETGFLLVGYLLLVRGMRRFYPALSGLFVALFVVFWLLGILITPHPETFASFFAVNLGVYLFARGRERFSWPMLLVFILACGLTRLEILFLSAIPVAVLYGWRDGDKRGFAMAGVLVASFAGLSVALHQMYPNAHYPADTDVIQIVHNLQPRFWLPAALCWAPFALLVWTEREKWTWRNALKDDVRVLLLWPIVHFATCCIVGRVEETRMFVPFAGLIGAYVSHHLRTHGGPIAGIDPTA